jgi:transposase
MDNNLLFEAALSIQKPWYIDHVEFDAVKKRLDIFIDFERGARFSSEEKGYDGQYGVYDTEQKTWRHLNFFEHECYLHCRTPRIKLDENTIRLVSPPWAGVNKGFTLLFEALLIQLCTQMPVKVVSRMVKETDQKIWRVIQKYVDLTRALSDYSQVTTVGMDETSRAKGHDYITLFVDLDERKTLFVADGKNHEVVDRFEQDLWEHNGLAENITDISCDMSPAFIKGVRENFPDAEITFDKFHIIKIINEAVDKVRKMEVKNDPLLKGAKYLFLKNESNLTSRQVEQLSKIKLSGSHLKSLRALQIRESFQDIYQAPTEASFVYLLKKWYFWATHSRLEPMKAAAKTIKSHWDGVVAWKRSQINNGILEGLNSIVQAARSRAKGFRNPKYYKTIVYLTTGKLNFQTMNPCVGTFSG